MPALVFRLRNVPEDEADAVRALLDEHHIDWYETSAGNWGIAMPGLWVRESDDTARARSLIEAYQQTRAQEQRSHYLSERDSGNAPSVLQRLKEQPFRLAGILIFCLFIVYVSVNPFLNLIRQTS